ncbi:MAG TPA: nicotinamide-nucleotide amidohydrolase family protein [Methylomirabilota bacterium]|nr:nicotinamide-nucleotide amidohydrolase family protein [Methylomirabilota bacterium]
MIFASVLMIAEAAADDAPARAVARALAASGIVVASRQVVDESEAALISALRGLLEREGIIVILAQPGGSSGELVPRAVSRLTGRRLVLHERRLRQLESTFNRRGQALPHRLERLALLPQGAELLPAAPDAEQDGWTLAAEQSVIFVVSLGSADPNQIIQLVTVDVWDADKNTVQRVLLTAGLSLTDAEERLGAWLGKEGQVEVVCLAAQADVRVRLRARGATRAAAEAALALVERAVREALGEDCYGQGDETLEAVVGRLLLERGLTVSLAESCTGGLVAHRLTNIPGSSRYVERGVVVYSNRAKEDLLGVPEPMLRAHGAVSAPVAEAMAAGIRRVSGSPCGLAVTGIAGPNGGTEAKPVGTVFIAAAAPSGTEVKRFRFSGGREAIKWQSAQAALDLLRRLLRSP